MTKVVISEAFGGYGLSAEARDFLSGRGHDKPERLPRDHPDLVAAVETLGAAASDRLANLVVVEIPDGIDWHIHEYDGLETLHENHRSWDSDGEAQNC